VEQLLKNTSSDAVLASLMIVPAQWVISEIHHSKKNLSPDAVPAPTISPDGLPISNPHQDFRRNLVLLPAGY
jgi:hypothetical protein